ncbi:hypothetical protein Scep_025698 [Stephania cephalantha]|uniref:Uncharacterized protein n=1 Tax=Stephania cephalantha TaxID=152367 RepID=A0AAP0HPL4_9MAGN
MEHNIPSDVNLPRWTQTLIALMLTAIPQKYALFRSKLVLMSIIRTQIWKACTSKNSK